MKCENCLHKEACAAWIRHGETLFDDFVYSVGNCPYYAQVVHGRWERIVPSKSAAKWSTKVSCSVCHKQGYTYHKYCSNCGAKMEG